MKEKDTKSKSRPHPFAQLMIYIAGKTYTHLVSLAANLGIADLLADGPKSVEDLAAATETHTPSLYRVLRVLDRMGVFSEKEPRIFSLNRMSKYLLTNSPLSVRDWAIMNGSEWHSRTWSNILFNIKTGKPSFDEVFGMKFFDYFEKKPDEFVVYNNVMTFFSKGQAAILANSYDFSNFQSIVDVGGGHGFLLATILRSNPSLQGILFDLPRVVKGAKKTMEKHNLLERCKIIGGDFFHSVPKGADAYIMKYVIHDWYDEKARIILKNCRDAIAPNGKLLVIDKVISLKSGLEDEIMGDIEMMILGGGLERTESEFKLLFNSAGFKLTNIIPTQLPLFILECEPI